MRSEKALLVGVGASLLVAAVVWAYGLYQTPEYEATAKVLVGVKTKEQQRPGIHPLPNPGASGPGLQALAATVAKAVPTKPVAQAVVERLNLPKGSAGKVLKNMSAEHLPGTTRINITYEDSEAKRAQLVANAIGQVLSQKISEVSLGDNRLTATVRELAKLPATPVSPKPLRDALIALGGGLALTLAGAIVAPRLGLPPATPLG